MYSDIKDSKLMYMESDISVYKRIGFVKMGMLTGGQ